MTIGIAYGWLTTDRDPGRSAPDAGATPTTAPSASPSAELEDRWWLLVRGRHDGQPIRPVRGFDITLNLSDRLASGVGGCNSYGGRLRIAGGDIRISSLAQELVGCVPDVNDAEGRYVRALSDVNTIEDSEARLVLSGQGVELVYEEMVLPPIEEISGRTWHLRSLLLRKDGNVVTREVRPATLELADDGRASAGTGCGSITGGWEVDGPYLSLTDTDVTGRCDGDTETQEQYLIGLLGRFTASLQADTLTLFGVGARSTVGAIYSAE